MGHDIDDALIEATWRFCRRQLTRIEDAEDCAQQILCEALRAIRAGREIEAFYGWYWALARRQVALFLRQKRRGAVSLEEIGGVLPAREAVEEAVLADEEISRLNFAVSRLSTIHRQAIVLHYLRGMKLADIAAMLGVPEGTVKRRLHDAKSEIRKEIDTMKTPGQASYAPAELQLSGCYSIPDYWDKITDLISTQIFVACHREARTIREIADEIGVAPVYFERQLAYLVENKFLREVGAGRYITDFIIYPKQAHYDCRCELNTLYADLGREIFAMLREGEHLIRAIGFRGCDAPLNRLAWMLVYYAVWALQMNMVSINTAHWADRVPADNGKSWRLQGRVLYPDETLTLHADAPKSLPWSNLHRHFRTSHYRSITHANLFQAPPFAERMDILTETNADLFMRICDEPALSLTESERVMAANLVEDGYLARAGEGLVPTMPILTQDQQNTLRRLFGTMTEGMASRYVEAATAILERRLLPLTREDLLEEFAHFIIEEAFFPIGSVFGYAWDKPDLLEQPEHYETSALGICIITQA